MNREAKLLQTLALATLLVWLGGCASCEQAEKRGGRASGNFDDDARRRSSGATARKNTASTDSDDELKKEFDDAPVLRDDFVFVDVERLPKTPVAAKPLPIASWLTIEGYSDRVNSASFAGGGKFLVTGGNDEKITGNTLKIWSVETGEEACAWHATGDKFSISRDGKLAAIVNSSNGKLSVRALETGEELYALERGAGRVAISPDGKYLAGITKWGEDAGLNLWAAETGQFIGKLSRRGGGVVTFSSDSKKVAFDYIDTDYKIAIVSIETQRPERVIVTPRRQANVIRFSADGNLLAAGFSDNTVRIWSLKEGKLLRTFIGHQNSVTALAISPDGAWLVSGESDLPYSKASDFSLRVWSIPNAELVATLAGHTDNILDLDFSPDGKTIVSVSKDKTIKLWKLGAAMSPVPIAPKVSLAPMQTLEGHSDDVHALAFSPDGKALASISKDNTMRLWSLATGKSIKTVEENVMGLYGANPLAFSPDGKYLASSNYDRGYCVKLWSAKTGAFVRALRELKETIGSISFSPDSKLLAAMSNSGMKIWSVETGKEALEIKHTLNGVGGWSAAFAPTGERIVTNNSEKNGSVKVWSVKTGAELKSMNSSGRGAIFISPDGKYVAVGKTICDMQSGQLLRRTEADIVAQSPNGEFYIGLRKKYNEKERRLDPVETIVMSARTGRSLARIDAHGGGDAAVAISPDGKIIATVDRDGTNIKLWKASGLGKTD